MLFCGALACIFMSSLDGGVVAERLKREKSNSMNNLAQIMQGNSSPGLSVQSPRSPLTTAPIEDIPEDVRSEWKALTVVVLGVSFYEKSCPCPCRVGGDGYSGNAVMTIFLFLRACNEGILVVRRTPAHTYCSSILLVRPPFPNPVRLKHISCCIFCVPRF